MPMAQLLIIISIFNEEKTLKKIVDQTLNNLKYSLNE